MSAVTTPKLSFPYEVDYNDHFETPLVAYQDILPLLDAVAPPTQHRLQHKNILNDINDTNPNTIRSRHILYDPYFCNGRTTYLLRSLGFDQVVHEKRDFYRDVEDGTVPLHHTLLTNPPYSANHKERCVRYAVGNLRCECNGNGGNGDGVVRSSSRNKPFFLLMPNYVACRDHFFRAALSSSSIISSTKNQDHHDDDDHADNHRPNRGENDDAREDSPLDILYVVPSISYEYDHPRGTGKEIPPFTSIWFCGIPIDQVQDAKDAFRKVHGEESVVDNLSSRSIGTTVTTPRLVSCLMDLKELGVIPTKKRRNPKQRKKERQRLAVSSDLMALVSGGVVEKCAEKVVSGGVMQSNRQKGKKKSCYRDRNGIRKKRRF